MSGPGEIGEPLAVFDPGCRRCVRLSDHLATVRATYPTYHAAPVPPFGPVSARLLIVGLAPGLHGANATGRPFTGDYAGILLYRTLYEFGWADRPEAVSRADGLQLHDCRITNAVKCLPPQNKPSPAEIRCCNPYLQAEIAQVEPGVILALGQVAHTAVLRALGQRLAKFPFRHGCWHELDGGVRLLDSYHCSRYNTQTRRLTSAMFQAIFEELQAYLATHQRQTV